MKQKAGSVLSVAITMTLLLLTNNTNAQDNIWTMYQGDANHTGYVPISLKPHNFALRWSINFGDNKQLNPVVAADGKVFVTKLIYFNDVEQLVALDAMTGTRLWGKSFGSVFSVNPPSYGYGNVYIQTGNHSSDTFLRAYNADTGDLIFKSPHSAQWERYYAPTIYEGKVYINGGSYGGMYSFDAYSGAQDWFLNNLPQYDQWTPSVDANYAYAYLGEYDPGLYVANRLTGEIAFKINDPNFDWNGWSMNLAPMLVGNQVYTIQRGRLVKFDVHEMNISWEIDGNFSGQPSYADGVIYAISSGILTALDAETGDELWLWEAPADNLNSSIVVTDTHIFVGSQSRTYAIDRLTHNEVWTYPQSGHISMSDNALYIASKSGNLTCISYKPFSKPTAVAGGDRIEYEDVLLNAKQSFDPDGYIVSYDWRISRQDGSSAPLILSGETVSVIGLQKGFYDVVLEVTDNDGFSDTDSSVLAVIGPKPQCEYTYEDVSRAYENGYNQGKYDHTASYNKETRRLHIPTVLVDKNEVTFDLRRIGNSHNFKLKNGNTLLKKKSKALVGKNTIDGTQIRAESRITNR